MKKIFNILYYIIIFLVVVFAIRGVPGNPLKTDINTNYWKEEGPFELSPERGRFAFTFSLVEDKSFQFDLPVARFALPDLGYINGEYVSLFAPGVSFLIIPGYLLGKVINVAQVGSFAVISLFAVLNVVLIETIARKLGARRLYSMIAALAFLFATPAFTYAVSLYQHHVSVFLLLAGIWVYLNYKSALSTWIIWFLAALSIPVDYPNLFMMAPLVIVAALRFFEPNNSHDSIRIKFNYSRLMGVFGAILPFLFFAWANLNSYGDPLRLAGTVINVRSIDSQGFPDEDKPTASTILDEYRSGERESNSVALGFFDSRNISNGLFIHFLSPDRGIMFYTPIVLFLVVGAFVLYKKHSKELALLVAISLTNIFTYSMWGDPWGGWAYGSRYLIPFYACSSILLAVGLESILRKKIINMIFLFLLIYSVSVNTLGAITSSTNPPKIEILALEKLSGKEEKYTYERNWNYLQNNGTKSFVYNSFLKTYLTPVEFYILFVGSLSFLFLVLIFYDFVAEKSPRKSLQKKHKNEGVGGVLSAQYKFYPPFKTKMRLLKNNFVFNWNRKISLWKNL